MTKYFYNISSCGNNFFPTLNGLVINVGQNVPERILNLPPNLSLVTFGYPLIICRI